MEGFIDIKGEIGSETTPDTVKRQIKQYPNATSWRVNLNSQGGNVYDGIEIYHLINKLPNVTVVIDTMAASIATLIMQAGQKVIALQPCSIMIHNPYSGAEGDANDLRAAAEQLDHVKSLITSVYKKRAKVKDNDLHTMMDKETWMTAEEAMALGFIDEVHDKLKAVARFNKNKNMDTLTKQEAQGLFDNLLDRIKNLFPASIKNLAATLADGTEVMIDTDDMEDLEGKKISLADGTPAPDGDHTLADGRMIVVTEGVITGVKVPEPAEPEQKQDEEMKKEEAEALKAENERLKAELAEAKGAAAKAAQEAAATNKAVKDLKASFEKELSEIKNKVVGDPAVPGQKPGSGTPNEGERLHPVFLQIHGNIMDAINQR